MPRELWSWAVFTCAAVGCVASETPNLDGSADVGITLEVSAHPNTTLGAVATVVLDVPASVRVQVSHASVGTLTTGLTEVGTEHAVDVIGLRADTAWTVQAVAELEDGFEIISDPVDFSSGSLPDGLPEVTVSWSGEPPAEMTAFGAAHGAGGADNSSGPYVFGVDGEGFVVWYYTPVDLERASADRSVETLADGNLQVMLPSQVQLISVAGDLIATFGGDEVAFHHDATKVASGNMVGLAREERTMYVSQVGEEANVVGDVLVEIDQHGEEVWSWSTFDHLDTARFPSAMSWKPDRHGDLDWTHGNSVWYDQDSGLLLVSLRHQSQVLAIDHATSELVWTAGADGDFSLASGEWFASQHAATFTADGQLIVYDNGNDKDADTSRAVTYSLDTDTFTATETWDWEVGFVTSNLGDADRLANGNTLVCAGGQRPGDEDARVVEVNGAGEVVWEANISDDLWVYRAHRVPLLTPVTAPIRRLISARARASVSRVPGTAYKSTLPSSTIRPDED